MNKFLLNWDGQPYLNCVNSLVYKIVHGLSPIYLQNLILTIQPERQLHLDLRNADHLTVPRCRISKTECSFRVSSIRLWNSLPRSLNVITKIIFPQPMERFWHGKSQRHLSSCVDSVSTSQPLMMTLEDAI
jgi:hypothetical protein